MSYETSGVLIIVKKKSDEITEKKSATHVSTIPTAFQMRCLTLWNQHR